MKKIKNAIYIIGAFLVIVKVFFRENISKELNDILLISAIILLSLIIIFEVFTKEK